MPEIERTTGLKSQLENEIREYLTGIVNLQDGVDFSQAKLIYRIGLFESHTYPTGKTDSQGNYKYWYDIMTPCINGTVKNIDFDTKNIRPKSDRKVDELSNIIVSLKIKDFLRDNGQAEEINSAVEEGCGWGNEVWKKVKKSYERVDLKNLYIINQTAENLDQTPVIERHQLSQSDLREKSGTWKYVDDVIKECKSNTYKTTIESQGKDTTVPYYDIYERNGEVCLKDLKEQNEETVNEGDEDKYVLAKVIGAGTKGTQSGVEIKYILFAEDLGGKKMRDIYKEFHFGRYKGRWWREGLYELMFDIQVRVNRIGNQISQGLEFASKTIFTSADKLIVQNILSDLKNGDIIKTQGISQVNVRMEGFDQLANEWNRLIQLSRDITNSQEIVQAINPPSGTPLGTTQMLNQNANKLFDFIREKLAIPFSEIFEEWLIPDLVDELSANDIVNLTGDSGMLDRVRQIVVDDWYIRNLINLPPHTKEIADALKQQELDNLKKQPQLLLSELSKLFKGYKENVYVDITGEADNITDDTQTLVGALSLEADPIRRSAMLDQILKNKGFDVDALPKSQPQPIEKVVPNQQQNAVSGVNSKQNI